MFTQLFETCRKTSESLLQMQQDVLKSSVQQLTALTPDVTGAATEWNRSFRSGFVALGIEALDRQREALVAAYDISIALLQQTVRLTAANTADASRAAVEDLWRELIAKLTAQSENQLRDAQNFALKSLEIVQKARA